MIVEYIVMVLLLAPTAAYGIASGKAAARLRDNVQHELELFAELFAAATRALQILARKAEVWPL